MKLRSDSILYGLAFATAVFSATACEASRDDATTWRRDANDGSSSTADTGPLLTDSSAETNSGSSEATENDSATASEPVASDSTVTSDSSSSSNSESDTGPAACNPAGYPVCADASTLRECPTGTIVDTPCGPDASCCDGQCVETSQRMCEPYSGFQCLTDNEFSVCDACGLSTIEESCGADHFCDASAGLCQCEYPINVLFVLDASGSMQLLSVSGTPQWDIARSAIADIMNDYPRLSYGLATFPDTELTCSAGGCGGQGGCDSAFTNEVIYDVGETSTSSINDYLASRALASDPAQLEYVMTPLVGIFDYLVNQYPAAGPLKTHAYPSYVVLISDGEDSCYNRLHPQMAIGALGSRVRALADTWKVKTFAIGFNLSDGADQLDAIAMNGGTGMASYIEASNLESLTDALAEVFDAINPRDCSGVDELEKPDCTGAGLTDNDSDGWCSSLDCADSNASINPGAAEKKNSKDDDCDGMTDEAEDEKLDNDGDGRSPSQGDCDDSEPLVGPSAIEVPGDHVDNDCDGNTDEAASCGCTAKTGQTLDAIACATEIGCFEQFVKSEAIGSPCNDDIGVAWNAVTRLGSSSNDLAPKAGGSYGTIGTGNVTPVSDNNVRLTGGTSMTDTFDGSGDTINDVVEYRVQLQAPQNAKGFSFDYVFFSAEYDEWVGSIFNDKFYVIMNGPTTTSGNDKIINYTSCRETNGYYDFIGSDCNNNHCCFIAINTALSDCCWYNGCTPSGNTDITGTGFECGTSATDVKNVTGNLHGSSTGWLATTWTVTPGELFTLTFHIHDTADSSYDSQVIIDNFRWHTTAVTPGTEPID